jgi:hypothetical protein
MLGLVLFTGSAFAQAKIPDLHIELSYRQLEEGKLSEGIHLFDLWCDNGRCDLTILTLNQCLGDRFFPKVEKSSNMKLAGIRQGNLQVNYSGNGILQLQEDIPDGKISYFLRFREARTENEKHQSHNSLFTRDDELLKRLVLTDFKGNLTKYSTVLDKVVSVEFVPLTEEYTVVKLNCGALIPGTSSLKNLKKGR